MNDEASNMQINEIPSWFSVVAWIAFVWNLMGVAAFVAQMMMTPEMLAALPEVERKMYENIPMWVTIAFACAVFGGATGSLLLALKKAISFSVLIISLMGVIVQMYHSFFVIDLMTVYGPGKAIMPAMVIIIATLLVWLANDAKNKGWIS